MLVRELVDLYLDFAKGYYRKPKSKRLTGEDSLIRQGLFPLVLVSGGVPVSGLDAGLVDLVDRWLKADASEREQLIRNPRLAVFLGSGVEAADADAALIASARRWVLANTDNCRDTVNGKVGRMLRMFKWASEPEQAYVPAETFVKVSVVQRLKYGRSSARETEDVEPVPREVVEELIAWMFSPERDVVRKIRGGPQISDSRLRWTGPQI